jgi:hypothetical protein
LPSNDAANGYVYPVMQYGHDGPVGGVGLGLALGGGYVVENGSALQGQYLFTEFATTGQIFHASLAAMEAATTRGDPALLAPLPLQRATIYFDHDNDPSTPDVLRSSMLDVVDDAPTWDHSGRADIRFGQGPDGELYLLSKRNGLVYLVTSSLPGSRRRPATVAPPPPTSAPGGRSVAPVAPGPSVVPRTSVAVTFGTEQ